jgi:hypothetical protein
VRFARLASQDSESAASCMLLRWVDRLGRKTARDNESPALRGFCTNPSPRVPNFWLSSRFRRIPGVALAGLINSLVIFSAYGLAPPCS